MRNEKHFETLQKCPLFDGVAAEDLPALLDCLGARTARFAKKETILAEGAPAKDMGVLLSGSAQVVRMDYFGNRSIMAGLEPPALFAESFACAGVAEMPVSVVAGDDTEVLFIDCRRLTRSCGRACAFHQQLIYNLMRILAAKNLNFHRKIEITSRRSTREKLMAYLQDQAKRQNSRSFTIPYDRQALADYLEVDRSGLSAEISKLRKEGVLESEKNYFRLL